MRKECVPVTLGSARFLSREVNGLLVTEAHFPPGLVLPTHIHERATVAVMLEGSFDCTFPTRTLPCQPGTLHTEPAEERHGNRVGKGGAHVVVIQPDQPATGVLGTNARVLERINHAPQTPATGVAWSLARELHTADTAAPIAIEGLVLEVFAAVVRSDLSDEAAAPPPRWLQMAQEYIHAHFKRPFRIGEVAREVNVNPVRLTRRFRRCFGLSMAAYARKLRLDWASLELRSSDLPLSVIATRAGFADQSHFTRAFRQHSGLTPRRFREAPHR
jgi:AraC family transcriptional regulator